MQLHDEISKKLTWDQGNYITLRETIYTAVQKNATVLFVNNSVKNEPIFKNKISVSKILRTLHTRMLQTCLPHL